MGLRYGTTNTSPTSGTLDMYLGDGMFKITSTSDHVAIQNNDFKYIIKPDLENKGLVIGTDGFVQYNNASFGGVNGIFTETPEMDHKIVSLYSTLPFITPARNRYTFKETKFLYGGEDEDSISTYIKPYIKKLCHENNIPYRDFNNLSCELQYLTSPIARFFGIPPNLENSYGLADNDILLCKNIDEVCISIFGISQPKLKRLLIARLFKFTKDESGTLIYFSVRDGFEGLCKCLSEAFTIDLAYNILSNTTTTMFDNPDEPHRSVYVKFLKELGYKYTMKLLSNVKYRLNSSFNDVVWQWEKYRDGKLSQKLIDKGLLPITIPRKCKSFIEIHDKVSIEYSKIKAVDEFKFFNYKKLKRHGFLKQLHKTEYNGHVIIFPESTAVLVDWGKKMKNCIASYSDLLLGDSAMVFALVKDGEMKYNIEVKMENNGYNTIVINQYSAYGNESQSEEEKMKLKNFIKNTLRI